MKRNLLIAAAFVAATALVAPLPAPAAQVVPAHAGSETDLTATGATASASALAVAEDDESEGYIDVRIIGDGSFAVSPTQFRITTAQGEVVAVATLLTERDPNTNQQVREITSPEVISSGEVKHLRFEFAASDDLGDATNLSVLSDASGADVGAWSAR